MRVLFFGDVFGRPGREILQAHIPRLREEFRIDVFVANAENLASGRGVTEKTARAMFQSGIDVATGGNHLWDRREGIEYLSRESRIVRPANFPPEAAGSDLCRFQLPDGRVLYVLSLTGQSFMPNVDSPFRCLENILGREKFDSPCILVDFHAEATAEKRALGQYFDGRLSAVIGTHTHIQTADEEILPGGTGYITDAGMTGPHDSVIGITREVVFYRIRTGMPKKSEIATSGLQINAVLLDIEESCGKCTSIERIRRKVEIHD